MTDITLNSEDPFEAALIEMVVINRAKRADYAGADWWAQNFYDTGYQTNTTGGMAAEALISTKQSRLRTLFKPGAKPKNEGIRDTLLDRAVYAAISLAMWDEGGYDPKKVLGCAWFVSE